MPTIFQEKVYTLLRQVPAGKVTTYQELAKAMHTKAYRAIGRAMRDNPYAPEVPCHRVVYSNGMIGGFKGTLQGTSILEKIKWLRQEGVAVENNHIVRFEEIFHHFSEPAPVKHNRVTAGQSKNLQDQPWLPGKQTIDSKKVKL